MKIFRYFVLTAVIGIAHHVHAVDAGFIGAADDYVTEANAVEGGGAVVLPIDPAANDGYIGRLLDDTQIVNIFNVCNNEAMSASLWDNKGLLSGNGNLDWRLIGGVTYQDVTSAHAGIRGAYLFDGSSGFMRLNTSGGDSYSEFVGASLDQADATFEMWVRPHANDLTQCSTLFECGGGTGTGIVIDNGVLMIADALKKGIVSYDIVSDPLNYIDEYCTNDFIQVVMTINVGGLVNQLYVNGEFIGSATRQNTDWDGGDGTSIGRYTGSNHGGFVNTAATAEGGKFNTYYHGAVSIYKLHKGVLTADQVKQNYNAIHDNTDINGAPIEVSGIYSNDTDVVTAVDAAIVSPSGATVTRSSVDNSLSYNPDGISDPDLHELWAGHRYMDVFKYQVVDGGLSTNSAQYSVAVQPRSTAVDDAFTVTQGDVRVFLPGELIGNDQQLSMNPWLELNTASITEQDFAAGVWRNLGTVGSSHDFTVESGELVDVASGFGGIGRAWRNVAAKGEDADLEGADDLTLEIWFKPAYSQSGDQILFEIGGSGNGFSVVYESDSNMVRVNMDGGDDFDPAIQLEARAGGVSFDEFNQLLLVYDRDNPGITDSIKIYINNDPAAAFDSTPAGEHINVGGGCNDVCGTDNCGIGVMNGTAAISFTPDSSFDGDVAIVNFYQGAMSVADMTQRYEDVKRGVISVYPDMTAYNAAVIRNPDGTVTYDTSLISTNLLAGESIQDMFTYTVSDGVGGTTTTNVMITVQGVPSFYTVADTITINAGGAVTNYNPLANDVGFTGAAQVGVGAVVYNYRKDYIAGTISGETADFRDVNGYGVRYMWNAPTNWVDGTSLLLDTYSGAMGETNSYRLLVWDPVRNTWMVNNSGNGNDGFPGNYCDMDATGPHAGMGSTDVRNNVTNFVSRGVILAYTVETSGYYSITNAWINKTSGTGDDMVLTVFVDETQFLTVTNAPLETDSFDVSLGYVAQGQDIYICVDSSLTESYDGANWDFDIVLRSNPAFEGVMWDNVLVTSDDLTLSFDTGDAYRNLGVGQTVYETFSYTVTEGGETRTGSVTVEIHGVNEAPVGVADVINANEDIVATGSLLANDIDIDHGDLLNLSVESIEDGAQTPGVPFTTPLGCTLTVNADGSYSYNPNGLFEGMMPGEFVSESFSYLVADSHGATGSVQTTFTVQLEGRDDGVSATDNAYTIKADRPLIGNMILDDTGSGVDSSIDDNDMLAILSVDTNGTKGVVTLGGQYLVAKRGVLTNLNNIEQTVSYGGSNIFVNPVVFATPMSNNGTEPSVIRITNVDPVGSTFDIKITEQPEDGFKSDGDGDAHADEVVSWVVFESGVFELTDGTVLEVGKVATPAVRQKGIYPESWETVSFLAEFTSQPVVINQLQSYNYTNELFRTRMDGADYAGGSVTLDEFRVAMEDFEYDQEDRGSQPETIGWIAVDQGTGSWSGNAFEASITAQTLELSEMSFNYLNSYAAAPTFIGCVATYAGADPCNLRLTQNGTASFNLLLRECTTADDETGHVAESATYLAIEGTGDLYAINRGDGEFSFDSNGELGDTSFTYTLSDSYGNTDTKTVTITVTTPYDSTLMIIF